MFLITVEHNFVTSFCTTCTKLKFLNGNFNNFNFVLWTNVDATQLSLVY